MWFVLKVSVYIDGVRYKANMPYQLSSHLVKGVEQLNKKKLVTFYPCKVRIVTGVAYHGDKWEKVAPVEYSTGSTTETVKEVTTPKKAKGLQVVTELPDDTMSKIVEPLKVGAKVKKASKAKKVQF